MKDYSISTKIILEEAEKRGIKILPISPGKVALLQYGDHIEYLYCQFISKTTSVASQICSNKCVTKAFLKKNGISISEGDEFNSEDVKSCIDYARKLGWPVVLKPVSAAHGDFVFADIQDEGVLEKALILVSNFHKNVIIEKRFVGQEYRITATRERVVAITNRRPANVIGDGNSTVEELIDEKNKDPRRGEDCSFSDRNKPLVKIKVDDQTISKLKSQNLTLKSIPKKGELILLRTNSNLSTGGDSYDYTDLVHPSVKKIAVRAINSIPGLVYGGIDFLSRDITKEQTVDDYIIIEINHSPGIFMHHFPYEGKPRDVASEIIDIAFPETKKDSK